MKATRPASYNARDIAVLDGIEAVRKRPGMYIGGTGASGLHHLCWEIVDNAVDEAMNGHATAIIVTLHKTGDCITVEDNGRGIPVDIHPQMGKSALEVVLTTLHAGGKFGGSSYEASGGLHGVGSSAVNALSSKLEARVRRDGQEWFQAYRKGHALAPVAAVGPARGTGTTITFTPDSSIFEDVQFDANRILNALETRAYLHRGLRIVFRDQTAGKSHEFKFDGGVQDYVETLVARDGVARSVEGRFFLDREGGVKLELAIAWTEATTERVWSYVNGIHTVDGGTHEQGFRDALAKALRSFVDTHDLSPRGVVLTAEDMREGLFVVLSLRMRDPQFQGQTKGRLNNPDVRGSVEALVRPALEQWLHANRSLGEAVVARAVAAARARMASRAAANEVRARSATSSRLSLPGKLADCQTSDPSERELFLVEGDSAGGSAKQARDRRTQAVLPLRGKVLNAEQANAKKLLSNEELSNIVVALGCGMGADYRGDRLRYQRVVLLMDADSDGHHIATLLLTFFFRFLRPLIDQGHLYLALPPLFRISAGGEDHWALDEKDRDRILASIPARLKPEITRFKGLGEMPPRTLFETTLDPLRRRLQQVRIDDPLRTDEVISELMGKDPQTRYRFITGRAKNVVDLDV